MLKIENLSANIGNFHLENISFEIPKGKYAVLMGKSGSGKTTLLETICGLKKINSGSIIINDNDVTKEKPADRFIGYVPQDGALFSSMTVLNQIKFGCSLRGYKKNDATDRAIEIAQDFNINHLLKRKPKGLSGGEIQRVALARALAAKPDFLCMDEPISSLDQDSKDEICKLLKKIHAKQKITILHVTHSVNEAELMGELILKLNNGAISALN